MFVEKLTREQIGEFLKEKKFSYYVSSSLDEKFLYVSTESTGNYSLYDFEGSIVANEYEWRKFLYEIFGEEYKQAYKKYLQEEMIYKLSCLDE